MKLGCHCVLFGPCIAEEPNEILQALAQSGCQGVEAGSRFLSGESAGKLVDALEHNHLELSGYHIIATFTNLVDNYKAVYQDIAAACDFLADKANRNIILTGMHLKAFTDTEPDSRIHDADFALSIAQALEKLACYARSCNVLLHYHNHSWEFEDDALIFKTLFNESKSLLFAMDIGWAASSGWDVSASLRNHPERFSYLHLRDYEKNAVDLTADFKARKEVYRELGEGDGFDWPTLLPLMAETVGEDGWLVVEYETGEQDPLRYKKALDFVRKHLK